MQLVCGRAGTWLSQHGSKAWLSHIMLSWALHFFCPAAHSEIFQIGQLVDASGMFHTLTCDPFGNHSPALIFLLSWTSFLFHKQVWEDDQWDVLGGDRATDPDRLDQAGSPLSRTHLRASPDQGHLWNQVPIPNWKVMCDHVHLLSVRGPDLDVLWSCQGWADLKFKNKSSKAKIRQGLTSWGCPLSPAASVPQPKGMCTVEGPAACLGLKVPKPLHRS